MNYQCLSWARSLSVCHDISLLSVCHTNTNFWLYVSHDNSLLTVCFLWFFPICISWTLSVMNTLSCLSCSHELSFLLSVCLTWTFSFVNLSSLKSYFCLSVSHELFLSVLSVSHELSLCSVSHELPRLSLCLSLCLSLSINPYQCCSVSVHPVYKWQGRIQDLSREGGKNLTHVKKSDFWRFGRKSGPH